MKYIKLIFAFTITYASYSSEALNASTSEAEQAEKEIVPIDADTNPQDDSDMIKTVYSNFVFAIDADPYVYTHPERYFTEKALKKLKDSYDFDCDGNNCYAFYEFRTQEQDSKPGTNGESDIINIDSIGDDWYIVTYSDMGWPGMTRIKIVDGKIDDYNRYVENLKDRR